MSLQYITETFVKIRNLCTKNFFDTYKTIPWNAVFGMRNFLSHEYGDADTLGIFNTVKKNIPDLLAVTRQILADVQAGKSWTAISKKTSCPGMTRTPKVLCITFGVLVSLGIDLLLFIYRKRSSFLIY